MNFDDSNTTKIPVTLDDGTEIYIEVTQQGREDVSFDAKAFKPIADALESIVHTIAAPIQKVRPSKATIKFGLEIEIKQGGLVAAIVKGTGKSNLEITLEWEK